MKDVSLSPQSGGGLQKKSNKKRCVTSVFGLFFHALRTRCGVSVVVHGVVVVVYAPPLPPAVRSCTTHRMFWPSGLTFLAPPPLLAIESQGKKSAFPESILIYRTVEWPFFFSLLFSDVPSSKRARVRACGGSRERARAGAFPPRLRKTRTVLSGVLVVTPFQTMDTTPVRPSCLEGERGTLASQHTVVPAVLPADTSTSTCTSTVYQYK